MANIRCSRFIIIIHIVMLVVMPNSCFYQALGLEVHSPPSLVPVALLLDSNSPFDSMLQLCIQIAVSDFYAAHSNYTTMLHLHTRYAHSLLDANFAVIDLLEHEKVEVVIGPQGSTEDIFVSELGQKSHVPIISFTARSSALPTTQNDLYVRTAVHDSIQAIALAAICQGFQWPQVVLLYEDTEYGHQFQSHLSTAFQDVDIGLVHHTPIPLSANDYYLSKLLISLNQHETRVFLVHMTPSLGYRLFNVAKNAGMMRAGYAWIITDSLSNFLSSMDAATRDSMEGVVGVRPYVPSSKDLINFQERLERNSSRASMDLNVFGLWAYDTIQALAIAAENLGPLPPRLCQNIIARDASLRISSYGPRLVRELSRTRFRGLSGYFELIGGSLKPSVFEILNLIGTGERSVGFWNPHRGIMREPRSHGEANYSTSTKELKAVVWPGDSTEQPKGWSIPPSGSLRVGVPWKPGFKQFVDVVIDPATNETRATGFAIDIFLHARGQIPFHINYTFYCYNESSSSNWSYDSMLHEIPEKYDMVVADTTIWAPRASYVDFTLPYSESGVVLVVRNNRPFDMWIFLKPLSLDLWMTIVAACIFMGFVIWRLESQIADPDPAPEDDRLQNRFLVPVAVLAFQERSLIRRKTSVFVLVCWLFTAFVLMQSYTANLSAIRTLDQIRFSFSEDHYFGYHQGSFTREFLTETLHMNPTRLIPYNSVEEYHDAMRKGSNNGGIDGIFDELPYMKILLNRYDSQYKIVGPEYRTAGLGFALPLGSPLVAHFSRAILNVTQGSEMTALEQKSFGPGYSSQDPLLNTVSQGASSLSARDFAGLFILLAAFTTIALVYVERANLITWGSRFINALRVYINRDYVPVDNGENHPNAVDAVVAAADGIIEDRGADGVNNEGQERGNDVNEARRELP